VTRQDGDEDAVLVEVVTPDGRRHAVAALADVPLRQVAAALVLLVGVGDPAHDLVPDGRERCDQATTLRRLGVLHGAVLRLVPHRPDGVG
jgi:hypothetical protein